MTRREAFEITLRETRAALPGVPAPGGFVDILALSDVVLAKVCGHYFDIPDGVHVKAGGFSVSNLLPPGVCPADYTFPSAYIFHPDPDTFLTFIGQRTGSDDVCPIFGGDRSKSPHPIHACPGFEMGFGILLGIVFGAVEHQANTGS